MTGHSSSGLHRQANADGELFDLGLRLLDRQLIGSQDELFGNVDNALVEQVDGELAVTALVCGPAALGPRFGGRTDVWMQSIWRRVRPEAHPEPTVIPMTNVVSVAAAVTLDEDAQQLVADNAQLERWLRYYVISRLPGATGGPDRLAGEPLGAVNRDTPPKQATARAGHLISDLFGARLLDEYGALAGVVLDVCSEPPRHGGHRVGALPLRALVYGHRRLGAEMGYTTQTNQGPWLVSAPLRAWHRDDRIIGVEDVTVDWTHHTVTATRTDRARHPAESFPSTDA
jgi:hypothetical protein